MIPPVFYLLGASMLVPLACLAAAAVKKSDRWPDLTAKQAFLVGLGMGFNTFTLVLVTR